MTTRAAQRERYSFGNLEEVLELPDLIAVQRESFQWLLDEGLAQTFRDISPIKDFTETLQLELEFDPDDEDLRPPPKYTVEECKEKDMTYSAPIFVRARFMNANTGEIKEQTVFMGDFPMMTDKGTFIINGINAINPIARYLHPYQKRLGKMLMGVRVVRRVASWEDRRLTLWLYYFHVALAGVLFLAVEFVPW